MPNKNNPLKVLTYAEFAALESVTMSANSISRRYDRPVSNAKWDREATHWRIELFFCYDMAHGARPSRSISFEYSQGSAHTRYPVLEDILYSLGCDASYAGDSHEEWCESFGYDVDSIEALNVYKACQKATADVAYLFGADFETFQNCVEERDD